MSDPRILFEQLEQRLLLNGTVYDFGDAPDASVQPWYSYPTR